MKTISYTKNVDVQVLEAISYNLRVNLELEADEYDFLLDKEGNFHIIYFTDEPYRRYASNIPQLLFFLNEFHGIPATNDAIGNIYWDSKSWLAGKTPYYWAFYNYFADREVETLVPYSEYLESLGK